MVPQWIIEKKRDGQVLTEEEIRFFIEGYTAGRIPDYQMAAMAMAIYFKGMTPVEIAALTSTMLHSGDSIDTSAITLPKVDKHSTGGIGDKVSIVLAPLAAAAGVAVPMISGRGLGITGGTLDKLAAIPGFRTDLSEKRFIEVIQACGFSMMGQTGDVAPADKKLYALRDVTATVPSIPLITASIMCKKLAEGIDSLVLDVKWGTGAFMQTVESARELARSMVRVGQAMGKGMVALITDMNQPLGRAVGNSLEIIESMECLQGQHLDGDLMTITLRLTAEMLVLGGKAKDFEDATTQLKALLHSGAAFETFKKMTELQGGDPSSLDDFSKLPTASLQQEYVAPASGVLLDVDANSIGRAALVLGGGRQKTDDEIDPAVGLTHVAKVGDRVSAGDRLATIHANDPAKLEQALPYIRNAFRIGEGPAPQRPGIIDRIDS